MARNTDSVCRLCRREGIKLFLKGERCFTDKCAIERRNYPPGQHGQGRHKFSEYSIQLREKQKVKRIYGVFERQFRRYFQLAERSRGITGENLLVTLERRLDNIASFLVKVGDQIAVRDRSQKVARIQEALELSQRRGVPEWLEISREAFSGTVKALPQRAELTMPINERLIVELYSK